MSFQIIVYEDDKYQEFFPLTYLRPVYTLRAGIIPLYKRIERTLGTAVSSFLCREQIAPLTASKYPTIPVNIIKKSDSDILFINGRIRNLIDFKDKIESTPGDSIFKADGETVAVLIKKESLKELPEVGIFNDYFQYFSRKKADFIDFDIKCSFYNYCWEIMSDIENEISIDFDFLQTETNGENINIDSKSVLINPDNIYLGDNTVLSALSLLDATNGPIYIGENTSVDSFASIHGPCYVGPNSRILRGKITASSIGEVCRIGGEVEHTVFQSYVNKYHDGFFGHSYVGSWVNIGAMTTNSDLKNNYSNIRTRLNKKGVDTNSNKVGSFIGDHTKFGIGTLLNTGINIGICCNLFGGTLITDKEIQSFSWGNTGNYKSNDVDRVIETAQIVMKRRDMEMNEQEIKILKDYYDKKIEPSGIVAW